MIIYKYDVILANAEFAKFPESFGLLAKHFLSGRELILRVKWVGDELLFINCTYPGKYGLSDISFEVIMRVPLQEFAAVAEAFLHFEPVLKLVDVVQIVLPLHVFN